MDFGHDITGIYFVSPPCTNNKHSYYGWIRLHKVLV